MRKFGLIGKKISYSFSRAFFIDKFIKEGILDASYENFDIDDINKLPKIIENNPGIQGLNVTIPYKINVIPYLDSVSKNAKKIGAVNTIKITKKGNLKGYNTDWYGFKKSISKHLKANHKRALILGTGGASKAIAHTLNKLHIDYQFVSRKPSKKGQLTYTAITENIVSTHLIIINCTPLGTFPNVENCPAIPYTALTKDHILFDLIYNPKQTRFLELGASHNAKTINGYEMLKHQALKAWDIWNK